MDPGIRIVDETAGTGTVVQRVIDESGEDYLYPESWLVPELAAK